MQALEGGFSMQREACGLGDRGCNPQSPSPQPSETYQSNFAPIRRIRGPMIVVGNRNVEPEPQLMFEAAFELVML